MASLLSFNRIFSFFLSFSLCLELGLAVLFDASSTSISNSPYDYVIAGCGISGLVLAHRLSEDAEITVLCLEAGTLDNNEDWIRYPYYVGLQPACSYEWCLDTVPQLQLDGQTRQVPMGKGVGGGSLINGMLWNRGGQVDFDNWAELGNPGWGWQDMLPYFQKSENFKAQWYVGETANLSASMDAFDMHMHGYRGPTNVSYPKYLWPQSSLWFEALEELGVAKCVDPNDGSNAGGYFIPLNIDPLHQTRSDARSTYYNPICERPNYNLAVNAQVTRIIFEGEEGGDGPVQSGNQSFASPVKRRPRRQEVTPLRATAVEFASGPDAPRQTVFARGEVILAAGAIHTPQLLELSGIGSPDVLTALNISVLQSLPGVGNNLQDHAMVHLNYRYQNNTFPSPDILRTNATFNAAAEQEYLSSRTGPWTAKPSTAVAFPSLQQITSSNYTSSIIALASLENATSYLPQSHLSADLLSSYAAQLPLILTALLSSMVPSHEILNDNSGGLDLALMRPISRGDTHITSPNPFAAPAINPNWLAHPLDKAIMEAAMLFNQKLLDTPQLSQLQPTFATLHSSSLSADSNPAGSVPYDPTPSDLNHLLTTKIGTEFHASCSAAMLPRSLGGVVSPNLTVYGTTNLRIVDAGIFPIIPGAHLQAVVYGVAEKAADLVRGKAPLV